MSLSRRSSGASFSSVLSNPLVREIGRRALSYATSEASSFMRAYAAGVPARVRARLASWGTLANTGTRVSTLGRRSSLPAARTQGSLTNSNPWHPPSFAGRHYRAPRAARMRGLGFTRARRIFQRGSRRRLFRRSRH